MTTDIVYLCLPTLYDEILQTYDVKELDSVLTILQTKAYTGLVLIKSTVLPTFCTSRNNLLNTLKIIHNPEFLTARTATQDFLKQHHIVLGFTPQSFLMQTLIKRFYQALFPDATISTVKADMAALMKLTCNSFYATKVQFFTEIYYLCQHLHLPYDELKQLVLQNGWIAPHHVQVPGPDGQVSYGGSCFPKDVAALSSFLQSLQLPHKQLAATRLEQQEMR